MAALLMTTLLGGGCAYNGYYTDYPYYGDYYYPYSYPYYANYYPYSYPYYEGYYPYYGGYYPYYGFSGGFRTVTAAIIAATTERAETPQTGLLPLTCGRRNNVPGGSG